MRKSLRSTWLLVVGVVAFPSWAAAADPLAQAEAAYSRVEFGDAERFAKAALAGGGYDRAQLTRIYFLLGVSAAAEGRDEEALGAFKNLLSIDPETKLDRGLSPKLQGPMLEARGTPPPPITCEAAFDRARGVLHFTIRDQPGMSRKLLVRSRLSGAAYNEARGPSNASVDVPIPGSAGAEHLEYFYQLLDEHQNRILEKGSEASPEIFQVAVAPPAAEAPGRKIPTKWLAVGIVGEVLGVVGIAGGIGAYLVGKDASDRWNNDSICLANGKSRQTNCSGDRSTSQAAESGTIASFTLGGVLIVASTILLIAAPRETRERKVAARASFDCGAGPGIVGVSCGGRF